MTQKGQTLAKKLLGGEAGGFLPGDSRTGIPGLKASSPPWAPSGAAAPSTPTGGTNAAVQTPGVYSTGNPITPYVGGQIKF